MQMWITIIRVKVIIYNDNDDDDDDEELALNLMSCRSLNYFYTCRSMQISSTIKAGWDTVSLELFEVSVV